MGQALLKKKGFKKFKSIGSLKHPNRQELPA
jgi:hypothetical protein